ncbi:chalcone-flavanone isomerase-domain-containing protein [Biscogniauxia mediterranea]|nr:chalcone-flavanone isomerase-domain-containing protein [Biscogniauxia mediterranea]
MKPPCSLPMRSSLFRLPTTTPQPCLIRQWSSLRSSPPSAPLRSRLQPQPRHRQQQRRTFLKPSSPPSYRAVEKLDVSRMQAEQYNYWVRRRNFLICGALAGFTATVYTGYLLVLELRKPKKFDSGGAAAPPDPFSTEAGSRRKTVVHDAEGREVVPTGNSTVPTFPRHLELSVAGGGGDSHTAKEKLDGGVEYTLVGLGVRTVSFLGIPVYMVGYYIATPDIAAIQSRLVKEINPIATTLVANEKEELRQALLDPKRGEALWEDILADVRPRSVFRIVPVRDTDFHHLRDGFVRAIQARSSQGERRADYADDAFAAGMRDFRALFNRGRVPKRREMLLCRDASGRLTITYDDGDKAVVVGTVDDERVSRLLWLNYLAGSKVASEPARTSIVDGIMEFVERPVGTVATQVL